MRKLLVLPVLVGLMSAATLAHAQTGQGCGGTVQSYQRFSYQPTPVPSVVQGNSANVAVGTVGVVPQNSVSPYTAPQVYRRYSYVPQSYYGTAGGHKKNLWEYAKGDPRRYRP